MNYVSTSFPARVEEPSKPLEATRDSQCSRNGWRKEMGRAVRKAGETTGRCVPKEAEG